MTDLYVTILVNNLIAGIKPTFPMPDLAQQQKKNLDCVRREEGITFMESRQCLP